VARITSVTQTIAASHSSWLRSAAWSAAVSASGTTSLTSADESM